ncbi:unnamed protein product [Protopolystoma xenopodis]|uniref:Uncharacterized protein n=1 Tax=Protopolystoma xenopodis TaxID=117903 RepID=A0A3S5AKE9_9PLAT|nr:unnamed protein product [Protopolystoma xenopodis]
MPAKRLGMYHVHACLLDQHLVEYHSSRSSRLISSYVYHSHLHLRLDIGTLIQCRRPQKSLPATVSQGPLPDNFNSSSAASLRLNSFVLYPTTRFGFGPQGPYLKDSDLNYK